MALKVPAFVVDGTLMLLEFSTTELGVALMMFDYNLKGSFHGAISNLLIVWIKLHPPIYLAYRKRASWLLTLAVFYRLPVCICCVLLFLVLSRYVIHSP